RQADQFSTDMKGSNRISTGATCHYRSWRAYVRIRPRSNPARRSWTPSKLGLLDSQFACGAPRQNLNYRLVDSGCISRASSVPAPPWGGDHYTRRPRSKADRRKRQAALEAGDAWLLTRTLLHYWAHTGLMSACSLGPTTNAVDLVALRAPVTLRVSAKEKLECNRLRPLVAGSPLSVPDGPDSQLWTAPDPERPLVNDCCQAA